ncbi:MAG TPA: TonB family protein [Bryobacteraceae bacterium]|nr:TonB family protein [Bryobacteraceae bacterium]
MFEQSFVQTQAATRRPWTVAVSLSLQAIVVGIVLLIPLLHPAMMRIPDVPKATSIRTWANLAPVPQRVVTSAPTTPSPIHVPKIYNPVFRPVQAVANRPIEVAATDPMAGWQIGPVAMPAATLTMPTTVSLPSAPSPPKAAAKPVGPAGPVPIGGDVEAAKLTYSPRPRYPQIAITARSEGTVRLEAIIAANGSIRNLRVLSGPPLLVPAAVDAVRQWKYRPTMLNGAAVEVVTEVEVNFRLSR